MRARPIAKPRARRVTFEVARRIALSLPGVEEGPCYGTPGFRVRGRLLARILEDGETLVLSVDPSDREVLMKTDPDVFFVTDHYRDYPWVLIRLSRVHPADLRRLLVEAWRSRAPKSLVKTFDGAAKR